MRNQKCIYLAIFKIKFIYSRYYYKVSLCFLIVFSETRQNIQMPNIRLKELFKILSE